MPVVLECDFLKMPWRILYDGKNTAMDAAPSAVDKS